MNDRYHFEALGDRIRLCVSPEHKFGTDAFLLSDFAAPRRKAPKSAKAPARRGRPPLSPEIYLETGGRQYNVTDIVERVKADYRLTHKVGVQSCKIYIKPEDGAAYYVVNKVEGKLDL